MAIQPTNNHNDYTSRKPSDDLPQVMLPRPIPYPQTTLSSTLSSPRIKLDVLFSSVSRYCPLLTDNSLSHSHRNNPLVRLPSLEEFDLGVEALARSYGPARPFTPPPSPSLNQGSVLSQPLSPPRTCGFHYHASIHDASSLESRPSPRPDGEAWHINQKYTTEQGDFIIYASHDKNLKWQRIEEDFAVMFGQTPKRTVQGLRSWYCRMNLKIPLWDQDGWLIFATENDLEPQYFSIKRRKVDCQDKPTGSLGLAQRYPERAIHYSWVDPELKRKCQDWAAKRAMQYCDRRERRKRREQRRLEH